MLKKYGIYFYGVPERTEMRRFVFFYIYRLDGNFQNLDVAQARFHQHIHFVFKAVTFCFKELRNDIGRKTAKPRLRVFDFCSAYPFEYRFCDFVAVARTERNVFFFPAS